VNQQYGFHRAELATLSWLDEPLDHTNPHVWNVGEAVQPVKRATAWQKRRGNCYRFTGSSKVGPQEPGPPPGFMLTPASQA